MWVSLMKRFEHGGNVAEVVRSAASSSIEVDMTWDRKDRAREQK